MKKEYLRSLLTLSGALLFNVIFWKEKFALNVMIFDTFILLSVFKLYPAAFKRSQMKWLIPAHAITMIAVLIHNTLLSKIAFSTTLLLVIVFAEYVHRSVWYAAASAFNNFFFSFFSFSQEVWALKKNKTKYNWAGKLRFLIIPLMIAAVFFLVYSFANVVFQNIVNNIGISIENFFSNFIDWFNWQRISFLLLGLFITGGLLLKSKRNYFSKKDIEKKDELIRERVNVHKWKTSTWYDFISVFVGRFATGVMGLKNENTVGIISLLLLNVMLLFINCIDIIYVWFGFAYTPDINLKNYVHEGTGMLIFSIVLAMMVLLFFFRGNLNFYKKNKWLKYGAYAWVIQNAILVISVFIRDGYYIQHMGLAYKRIGVIVFLVMVLMGLFTMFLKVSQQKTNYFLWKVNGWFAIIVLVSCSCIHWDEQIASYNLARKNTIPVDVAFLLSMSDKTLPLLEKNRDVLSRTVYDIEIFEARKTAFFDEQKEVTWLSWNLADEYIKKHLSVPSNKVTAKK